MSTKSSLVVGSSVLLVGVLLAVSLRQGASAAAQEPAGPAKARAAEAPIVSGKLLSVQVWERPVEKGGTPYSTPAGGRIEVYDRFIITTSTDGVRSLHLHGWYTNLRFRSE